MYDPSIICESPRLIVRRLSLEDASFLFRLFNEPSWISGIGDRGVRSVEDASRYIESRTFAQYRSLGYGMNALILKETGAAIGVCGLTLKPYLPCPDIGFAVLEQFRGHGYATEAARAVIDHAAKVLGIQRLAAVRFPDNERSARVLERLGFRFESGDVVTPEAQRLLLYVL